MGLHTGNEMPRLRALAKRCFENADGRTIRVYELFQAEVAKQPELRMFVATLFFAQNCNILLREIGEGDGELQSRDTETPPQERVTVTEHTRAKPGEAQNVRPASNKPIAVKPIQNEPRKVTGAISQMIAAPLERSILDTYRVPDGRLLLDITAGEARSIARGHSKDELFLAAITHGMPDDMVIRRGQISASDAKRMWDIAARTSAEKKYA